MSIPKRVLRSKQIKAICDNFVFTTHSQSFEVFEKRVKEYVEYEVKKPYGLVFFILSSTLCTSLMVLVYFKIYVLNSLFITALVPAMVLGIATQIIVKLVNKKVESTVIELYDSYSRKALLDESSKLKEN